LVTSCLNAQCAGNYSSITPMGIIFHGIPPKKDKKHPFFSNPHSRQNQGISRPSFATRTGGLGGGLGDGLTSLQDRGQFYILYSKIILCSKILFSFSHWHIISASEHNFSVQPLTFYAPNHSDDLL
jgi:hypothetical protein